MAAFPGFERFYLLRGRWTNVFHANIGLSTEQAFPVLRAEMPVDEAVSVRWVSGRRKPQDFIWTSFVVPIVVSAKVLATLHALSATGWASYKVDVRGADDEHVPGYAGLSVRGRCGPIRHDRGVPVQKEYPGGIYTVYLGYLFDEHSWDGSDLFVSEDGSGTVFVSQRVRDAFVKAKVTGVTMDRADLAQQPGGHRQT